MGAFSICDFFFFNSKTNGLIDDVDEIFYFVLLSAQRRGTIHGNNKISSGI